MKNESRARLTSRALKPGRKMSHISVLICVSPILKDPDFFVGFRFANDVDSLWFMKER
jgi:hypothetical protein